MTVERQGLRGIMLDSWSEEKLFAHMAVAEIIKQNMSRRAIHSKRDTPSSVVVPSIWKLSAGLLGSSVQVCNSSEVASGAPVGMV